MFWLGVGFRRFEGLGFKVLRRGLGFLGFRARYCSRVGIRVIDLGFLGVLEVIGWTVFRLMDRNAKGHTSVECMRRSKHSCLGF